MSLVPEYVCSLLDDRKEARIFDLVLLGFSENCGYTDLFICCFMSCSTARVIL